MELQNGRPESTEGRLEKEIRVYDFLDALEVEYHKEVHAGKAVCDKGRKSRSGSLLSCLRFR